jgi:hypothetical protein
MAGDHRTALTCLKIGWQLGVWFHRTFKDASFRSGPFVPPRPPAHETADVNSELERLRSELETYRACYPTATWPQEAWQRPKYRWAARPFLRQNVVVLDLAVCRNRLFFLRV